MRFLTPRIEQEWKGTNLKLMTRLIVEDAAKLADYMGWDMMLTCVYRTPEEDKALDGSTIHSNWRAVDVRTRDVPQEKVDKVVASINAKWEYDPSRPSMVVAYDKPHGTAKHLHIQTHPNTRVRIGF